MKHRRRNFWIHSVEGGVYMGGIAFLSPESVMPPMIRSLGGAPWMIALMPVIMLVGFYLPNIFFAPLADRMRRLYPYVMTCGFIQRMPYLVAAAALWFWPENDGGGLLWIVFLAPLISGLSGGFGTVAWMEMVTRMVPERDRSTAWALRFIIRAAIGSAAGLAVYEILKHFPGQPGYAILHILMFLFIMLSFAVMCFMREEYVSEPEAPAPRPGYWSEVRLIPGLVLGHRMVRRYVGARLLGPAFLILAPYLSIHVLETTGRPEKTLGYLVTATLLGNILGNALAAWMGRRWGGKSTMLLGRVIQIGLCILLWQTTTLPVFCATFFIFGFVYALETIGDLTWSIELCPKEKRPFYISGLNLAAVIGMLFCSGIGAAIEYGFGTFRPAIAAALVSSLLSMIILFRIHEPRGRSEEPS